MTKKEIKDKLLSLRIELLTKKDMEIIRKKLTTSSSDKRVI